MAHKLKKMLTDNIGLKVIALVLAILIWLFVSNQNDPVRSMILSNVPISIVNEDSFADIGMVAEPEGSGTVTLKVTERRSVLNRLARNGSNFYVEADLENINEMNTVPLKVTCDNFAVTWDEISISPASLKVSLEEKAEQQFAVNVSPLGEVSSGYTIGRTEVKEGKTILIAGPSSLVGIINQVTAPVAVSGLSEDSTLSAGMRIYDRNGSELSESQMSRLELKDSNGNLLNERTVTVNVYLWKVKSDIAIGIETIGTPAEGFRIESITTVPETITLAGSPEALENLGDTLRVDEPVYVDGASEQITKEIDLSDTVAGYSGLKFLNDSDTIISVTVLIEKTGDISLDLPLAEIKMENRPQDMKLVFTPADKITVRVQAPENDKLPITAEEITAKIDLSECAKEGAYEIPVEVELPEGYVLSTLLTVKVISAPLQTEEEVATE